MTDPSVENKRCADVWYVRDVEGGLEEYASEKEASKAAHDLLAHYRENAPSDGWPADIAILEWGQLEAREVAEVESTPAPEGSEFDEYWSVHLEPVANLETSREGEE